MPKAVESVESYRWKLNAPFKCPPVDPMKPLKPFLTALALLIGAFLVISALALCVAEFLVGGSL